MFLMSAWFVPRKCTCALKINCRLFLIKLKYSGIILKIKLLQTKKHKHSLKDLSLRRYIKSKTTCTLT